MFESIVKIPRDRVAVLIGKQGETKRILQKITKTKIQVDKEGEVLIIAEDTMQTYVTVPIIKAIGRGFNPEIAVGLLQENSAFELVNIQDFAGKSVKKLTRIKSRLIGTNGKARGIIERLTHTHISIYGKTVGIIGGAEEVFIAKQAIEKLLGGAPHGHVYKFIDDANKKLQQQNITP